MDWGLEEGDLQSVRVLNARIPIAPRRDNRGMDERGAMRGQSLDGGIQVRHLQREADLPAGAFPRFELVNHLRLALVEEFERGLAHFEHERASAVVVPDSGGFETQPIAVEFDEPLVVTGGDGDAQLKDGAVWMCHVLFHHGRRATAPPPPNAGGT